jgi:DNA modification methylase
MSDITWTLRTFPIEGLTDYYKNPRSLSKIQFEQLKKSLDKFGMIDKPIINADEAHTVIGGHQRLHVLRAEGVKQVECWLPSRLLTEKEVEELNIRLNKNTGSWDFDVLANEWEFNDLIDWGFTDEELKGLDFGEEKPEDPGAQIDKAEELREKWGVESGQLWKLGEHRLICGDCTDRAVVERVCDIQPEMMVTDPPYGVEYDPSWRVEAGVQERSFNSGKVENDDNSDWTPAWELFSGDVAYVWHAGVFSNIVQASLEICGFVVRAQIIWNKDLAVFGRGDYHWKHEPCWYVVRKGKNGNRTDDHAQSTIWDIPTIHSFANGHNAEEWKLTGHGTQKPVECMERPIRNHKFDVVYDPFLGSGTTLIACERLSRKCRAVEISPAYVAVAIQRWVDMTGGTPELLSS